MDLRAHERGAVMGNTKRDSQRNYFTLPNTVFDLKLHVYELAIYAYLLRIEDRRIWQCVVSYPTIAEKLGISVNTAAWQRNAKTVKAPSACARTDGGRADTSWDMMRTESQN